MGHDLWAKFGKPKNVKPTSAGWGRHTYGPPSGRSIVVQSLYRIGTTNPWPCSGLRCNVLHWSHVYGTHCVWSYIVFVAQLVRLCWTSVELLWNSCKQPQWSYTWSSLIDCWASTSLQFRNQRGVQLLEESSSEMVHLRRWWTETLLKSHKSEPNNLELIRHSNLRAERGQIAFSRRSPSVSYENLRVGPTQQACRADDFLFRKFTKYLLAFWFIFTQE